MEDDREMLEVETLDDEVRLVTPGKDSPRPPATEGKSEEEKKSEIGKASVDEILAKLKSTRDGLTANDVKERLSQYGKNQLPSKSVNPLLKFLSYFWNPLSWLMEFAALLAIVLGDYVDFILISLLLILNAVIGYYEERSGGKAVEALKSQLSPNAYAKRDGEYQMVSAFDLVPGDVIRLRIGDVIPADAKLLEGDPIKLDQSSLTGESLPVTRFPADECFSGAVVKQGEIDAVVYATGVNTFFGTAANLVQSTTAEGHFQTVLKNIGYFCIYWIAIWVSVEMIVQFAVRWDKCTGVGWGAGECKALENLLVLIVGGTPIAMPVVLSVTMALGAGMLAKKKAIVTRLTAVEELAGMNILCSDKTGTLTLNKLTLESPDVFEGDPDDVMFMCALAASRIGSDAIDTAVLNTFNDNERLDRYEHLKFIPFDPVSKRVTAQVQEKATGQTFWACKGAPQIILNLAYNKEELRHMVEEKIDDYASRGFRVLGVARANDPEGNEWHMLGMIPMFDPPRHDTAETIKKAQELGIGVKMITGDQAAIARETCKMLDMGNKIESPKRLEEYATNRKEIQKYIADADGFAGVYPEHKFEIVKILQDAGNFVGMTGDGVNDAPALKVADIGIAVADATEAARAAADIVLLTPGLGVIIDAIIGSRKIFQRMRNYSLYAITTCVRITVTFGLLTVIFDWYFTVVVIAIMAILNDGTIMTIAKDRVKPSPLPDHWSLANIFVTAIIYGTYLSAMTITLYVVVREGKAFTWIKDLNDNEMRGLIYLYVSISGQAVIFITRSRGFWFMDRPSVLLMIAFVIAQTIATIIGIFGFGGYPFDDRTDFEGCGWAFAILGWIWAIITFFAMDFIKFAVYGLFAAVNWIKARFAKDETAVVPKKKKRAEKSLGHPIYGRHEAASFSPFSAWGSVPVEPTNAMDVHSTFDAFSRTMEDIKWPHKPSERTSDSLGA